MSISTTTSTQDYSEFLDGQQSTTSIEDANLANARARKLPLVSGVLPVLTIAFFSWLGGQTPSTDVAPTTPTVNWQIVPESKSSVSNAEEDYDVELDSPRRVDKALLALRGRGYARINNPRINPQTNFN